MKLTEEYIAKVIEKVQKYMLKKYQWKLNEGEIRLVLEIEHGVRK